MALRPNDVLFRWLEGDDIVTAIAVVGFYVIVGIMATIALSIVFPDAVRGWVMFLGPLVVLVLGARACRTRLLWHRERRRDGS